MTCTTNHVFIIWHSLNTKSAYEKSTSMYKQTLDAVAWPLHFTSHFETLSIYYFYSKCTLLDNLLKMNNDHEKVASIRLNKIFEWLFLSGVSLPPSHTCIRAVNTSKSFGTLACVSISIRVRVACSFMLAWIRFASCTSSVRYFQLYISDGGKKAIKWFLNYKLHGAGVTVIMLVKCSNSRKEQYK